MVYMTSLCAAPPPLRVPHRPHCAAQRRCCAAVALSSETAMASMPRQSAFPVTPLGLESVLVLHCACPL